MSESDDERISGPPALEGEQYRWTDDQGLQWAVGSDGKFYTLAAPSGWIRSVVPGLGPLLLAIHCRYQAAELAACRARDGGDLARAVEIINRSASAFCHRNNMLTSDGDGNLSPRNCGECPACEAATFVHEYNARHATASTTTAATATPAGDGKETS